MDALTAALWARPFTATFAVSALVLVTQVIYKGYRQRALFRNLPGPPHHWLLGHLAVMGEVAALMPPNTHPQAYYTEIARRYDLKGIFYIDVWPIGPAQVVLSDPALLEEVTTVRPLQQHQQADDFMSPIVGKGLIATTNGPLWKMLHRAMSPAFSWSHIRSLTDLIVDECSIFRANLDRLATTGEVFSVEDLSAKLVFDVIARALFNFPLHAQTRESPELRDLNELVELVHGEADITIKYNPVLQVQRSWRRRQLYSRLHPLLIGKIKERFALLVREEIVPSRKNPNSILDLMLREYLQPEGKTATKKTPELSQADIDILLTNVKGLLLGGHGTTTDTLCYIYMLLSKHPEVVDRVRQEYIEVFGSDFKSATDALVEGPEKLQNLPYTDAVIRETLRLFPVGFGMREASSLDQTLEFEGQRYPIGHGLGIVLNGHDLHYNERFFPEPTKFMPERWLSKGGKGNEEGGVPRSYFRSFSAGPRGCLGSNLAMNELKIILFMTIRDYEFEYQYQDLKPNAQRRTTHTDLDTVYGDCIFQELGIEARPRGKMMMVVRKPF